MKALPPWVRIKPKRKMITVFKPLRDKYFSDKKINILFDEEKNLLGLQPAEYGYKLDGYGRIKCGAIIEILPEGTFPAVWNDRKKILIVDLQNKL